MGGGKLTLYSLVLQPPLSSKTITRPYGRGVSPAFVPRRQLTLVMLADKHTRNLYSLSTPSDHGARGVLAEDALARTPLWSMIMKPYPSANGHRERKQAYGNDSGQLALDYLADEGWQWREDIRAWANPHHVLSLMVFKRQKPSQTKEPPIPGLSPSSQPPEDVTTCEPEPEVAPMQSTEEPFSHPTTPRSIIIIDDTPVGSPPLHTNPSALKNPNTSSPRFKAPLIPTMTLARNSPTYD
ncbi:hypothetical protein O181_044314 [Austropuccinia psidii MF-1]|uniref:Uncharacterized protein n=1 Tax=Austropuccinia psidii MF-1 TaxID=1389203 RepID=A0A9Q3DK16_9BASI|nr:hypothetical protein [Austropuccinia psidii MF-1]